MQLSAEPSTPSVASPTPTRRCFIISPIGQEGSPIREHADDVFDYIIKPAMDAVQVNAIRSDHLHEPGLISEQMLRAILEYDCCVAVLTFHNPNVFYELAMAQAASRPVVILIEKGTPLPFDIQDLRCVYYDLKPRSLFDRVYSSEIVKHMEALQSDGWRSNGPLKALLQAPEEGPCKVLAAAEELGRHSQWLELLKGTQREFAITGINLNQWKKTRGFEQMIKTKAEQGCRIRIMLMAAENPAFRSLINDSAPTSSFEEVSVGLKQTTAAFERLATSQEGVELRLIRNGCPHFNLTLTDDEAIAIQYLYSTRTDMSPVLRSPLSSPLYTTFQQEFDSLWEANAEAR